MTKEEREVTNQFLYAILYSSGIYNGNIDIHRILDTLGEYEALKVPPHSSQNEISNELYLRGQEFKPENTNLRTDEMRFTRNGIDYRGKLEGKPIRVVINSELPTLRTGVTLINNGGIYMLNNYIRLERSSTGALKSADHHPLVLFYTSKTLEQINAGTLITNDFLIRQNPRTLYGYSAEPDAYSFIEEGSFGVEKTGELAAKILSDISYKELWEYFQTIKSNYLIKGSSFFKEPDIEEVYKPRGIL